MWILYAESGECVNETNIFRTWALLPRKISFWNFLTDDKFGCHACVKVMHAGQESWVWGARIWSMLRDSSPPSRYLSIDLWSAQNHRAIRDRWKERCELHGDKYLYKNLPMTLSVMSWVLSSVLTAHQHKIGHSVPYSKSIGKELFSEGLTVLCPWSPNGWKTRVKANSGGGVLGEEVLNPLPPARGYGIHSKLDSGIRCWKKSLSIKEARMRLEDAHTV